MGYSGTGHILGQHERQLNESNAPKHKKRMDQDTFLKLLITQLSNQNPMKPMDEKEMTGQLAEFSSLEQLTSINKGIKTLSMAQDRTDMLNAVSFIGKEVKAQGYKVTLNEGNVSKVQFGLGEPVAGVTVNIYDSEGAIVRTDKLGAKGRGEHEYVWNGLSDKDQKLPDGTYSVGILAEDTNGKPVMIRTEISGEVTGIVRDNGQSFLRLKDGRYINFANVIEVVEPNKAEPESNPDSDSGTDSGTNTNP